MQHQCMYDLAPVRALHLTVFSSNALHPVGTATEAQFVMSIGGMSLQLLRATGVHPNQLMLLLQHDT